MARSPRGWTTSERLDAVGLAIVVVLAAWVGLVAGDGAGRPGPVLWLLAGLVAAFATGRALVGRPGFVPRVIAGSVAGAVALTWPGILRAGGAPLGYANANATLTSLGVIAALGAARACEGDEDRRPWLGLALALGVATLLTGSVAGSLSLAVALALLAVAMSSRRSGVVLVGGALVVAVALAVTTAIAFGGDPLGLGDRSGLRGELWVTAADLIEEAPLRGIGPGGFETRTSVSTDLDLRWAHHGYLQAAAELGVIGLALVLALSGWLWVVLWRARDEMRTALGAAALLIVALHGTVDWVWHVPALLLVLAALLAEAAAVDARSARCADSRRCPRARG